VGDCPFIYLYTGDAMSRLYGILKSATNTGIESELAAIFAAPLSVSSNQPAFVSDTISLRRRVASQDAQRWEVESSIKPTNDSAAFIVSSIVAGYTEKIYARMPQIYGIKSLESQIDDTGEVLTLTTVGTASIGSNIFTCTGIRSHNFASGEFIQFDTDSKVYIVIDPGVNGVGVIISPKLRLPVYPDTIVKFGSKVTLAARYDTTMTLGMKYIDGILVDPGTIKLVEAL
jgi:hypothetical protein